jgi:hypothetical protein
MPGELAPPARAAPRPRACAWTLAGVPTPMVSPRRDLVASHLPQRRRHVGHRLRRDRALVGAADHARHIAAHLHPGRMRRLGERAKALQRLGDRAVDVLLAEGFGGGAEHRDLLRPGGERGLEALQVGGEHRVGDARHRLRQHAASATSALSPICGTHLGDTKEVVSIAFSPARSRRRTSSSLVSVETSCFSFCRPSRGPTLDDAYFAGEGHSSWLLISCQPRILLVRHRR